jgi:hypothetical protein
MRRRALSVRACRELGWSVAESGDDTFLAEPQEAVHFLTASWRCVLRVTIANIFRPTPEGARYADTHYEKGTFNHTNQYPESPCAEL